MNKEVDALMVANHILSPSLEQLHPEMNWRLKEFVEDYAIGRMPALIWQWRPCTPVEVDVSTSGVRDLFSRGAESSKMQAWWYGFRSNYGVAPVFSGLSTTDPSTAAGWAAEIHTDGHLIAGLWNFPEVRVNGTPTPCLSDFHLEGFRDFAQLSEAAAKTINSAGSCCITATLLAADTLQFVRGGNHWNQHTRVAKRNTMQWRVRKGPSSKVRAIGEAMAADYKRAFAF